MRSAIARFVAAIAFVAGSSGAASAVEPAAAGKPLSFAAPIAGPAFTNRAPSGPFFARPVALEPGLSKQFVLAYFNWPGNPNRPEPVKVLRSSPQTFKFSEATRTYVGSKVPSLVHPRVITSGDFNGDGKADVFIGGHGYDAPPFAGEPDWTMMSGVGLVRTANPVSAIKTYTHATASADIDRDGTTDVYVGALNKSPYFLMGTKGGAQVRDTTRLPAYVRDRTSVYISAALVDVDADGWPDLILGGDGGGVASRIYLNDRKGSFAHDTPDTILPAGLFGQSETIVLDILPADVNSDGRVDLILAQTDFDPFYKGFGIQVLINLGGGRFRDETAARMPNGGIDATRDSRLFLMGATFYGDGLADIVASRFIGGADEPLLWLNDGSGKFSMQPRTLVDPDDKEDDGNIWVSVDVNGDKRTDLARVAQTAWDPPTHVVRTYLNRGVPSGTPAPAPVVVRSPPASVALALKKSVSLSIAVRGARPMAFKWSKNGSPVAGGAGPVLVVRAADASAAGTYSVDVTTRGGTVTRSTVVTVD